MATSVHPADLRGMFNLNRSGNPIKDWDMVYVPYCTADLHAGTATRTYENVGHPVYTALPSSFPIRHNGYSNTMVVLDWIRKNLRSPERVLVAGSSAGGYGASIHFPWLRQLFPAAQISVMADASQGVTTPTWDQSTPGRGSWSLRLPAWSDPIGTVNVSGPELLRLAAQSDPLVAGGAVHHGGRSGAGRLLRRDEAELRSRWQLRQCGAGLEPADGGYDGKSCQHRSELSALLGSRQLSHDLDR